MIDLLPNIKLYLLLLVMAGKSTMYQGTVPVRHCSGRNKVKSATTPPDDDDDDDCDDDTDDGGGGGHRCAHPPVATLILPAGVANRRNYNSDKDERLSHDSIQASRQRGTYPPFPDEPILRVRGDETAGRHHAVYTSRAGGEDR